MTDRLSLPPHYLRMVEALLSEHVPDAAVWAYGSRVNGQSHEGSDLDLVVRGPDLEPLGVEFLDLVEALQESNIPILVQVHDWANLPERFHTEIEREYVVIRGASERPQERHTDGMESAYGTFPSSFAEATLGSLCSGRGGIQTGPFGSQLHQRDYVTEGTPIITVEHLAENRITHRDMPYVSDCDRERLSRYSLRKGDIVFSRVGSVDRRALVRQPEEGWLFSGRCLRVRPNEERIDPAYLSYFFGLPAFKEYIRSISVGATMPSLNTQILSEVSIFYPPLSEQRAIAHILGTLDDKIELNRRMNETLEAMARALFKSWFVDFEPVRAKMEGRWRWGESLPGLPAEHYDLFPDRLVDSELGEIPEGWEVKALGDVVELANGKALRAVDRKDGPVPVYGSNGQVGWHDKEAVGGPGIVVGRKGNPGVVTWAHGDFFPIDTTFYVVPRDSNGGLPFLFFALTGQDLPSVSADSAVPGLNRNLAYMNPQLVPDTHVLAEFNAYASAIFSRQYQLEEECQSLAAQRDALLPGLVSRELRLYSA